MKKRILFNCALLAAVFYMPWWVVAILASIGVFLFPSYYEIIAFGALVDLLYGTRILAVQGILGILGSVVIFVLITYVKKLVRN